MVLKAVRNSLVDQVYTYVLSQIQSGELRPGHRLNIEEIAQDFGVSRTPVREAINRLTENGFVEMNYNSSPCIAQLQPKQALDLVEANARLFDLLFDEFLLFGIDKEMVDELDLVVEQQRHFDRDNDLEKFQQASCQFHFTLISYAKNGIIKSFLENTQRQLNLLMLMVQVSADSRKNSIIDHGRIIDRLRAGDICSAKELMDTHNLSAMEACKGIWDTYDECTLA